ncbi:hypothetical protein PR048_008511 [Dryococelus australis]|uniref:Uncharacterized protein n=1 Tax=Dryococelus australis TaxID=614101 RepID=A0ABQ9HXA9_9NEOP|nr:hypothetical protein PR048_008511 [Dryococelus australis]
MNVQDVYTVTTAFVSDDIHEDVILGVPWLSEQKVRRTVYCSESRTSEEPPQKVNTVAETSVQCLNITILPVTAPLDETYMFVNNEQAMCQIASKWRHESVLCMVETWRVWNPVPRKTPKIGGYLCLCPHLRKFCNTHTPIV